MLFLLKNKDAYIVRKYIYILKKSLTYEKNSRA